MAAYSIYTLKISITTHLIVFESNMSPLDCDKVDVFLEPNDWVINLAYYIILALLYVKSLHIQ